MSGLRQTPIHSALYRPTQVLGCDRALVIVSLTVSAWMALGSMDLIGMVSGAVFAFLAIAVFRRMAKADPMMREVYFRHIKYAPYYHPFSRPARNHEKKGREY